MLPKASLPFRIFAAVVTAPIWIAGFIAMGGLLLLFLLSVVLCDRLFDNGLSEAFR
jgi:hypothetical protein